MNLEELVEKISSTIRKFDGISRDKKLIKEVGILIKELNKQLPDKQEDIKVVWELFKSCYEANYAESGNSNFYTIELMLEQITGYRCKYLQTIDKLDNLVRLKKKEE